MTPLLTAILKTIVGTVLDVVISRAADIRKAFFVVGETTATDAPRQTEQAAVESEFADAQKPRKA